jgi:KipI family sensor histidine kinase inhibitor
MRVLNAGPYGVLLEFDSGADTRRCYRVISEVRGGDGYSAIVDVVPAERTVLVVSSFDALGQRALRTLVGRLEADGLDAAGPDAADGDVPTIELPVRYDGPDLDEVAALTGLTTSAVVALHTDTEFTVAFTGFAPGFGYLTGLPDTLTVPRRAVPRTRVEAGAVGLAGPYSGVYPRASPGGWRIIGHLAPGAEALWDVRRAAPALLQPGMRVRFRAEDGEGQ